MANESGDTRGGFVHQCVRTDSSSVTLLLFLGGKSSLEGFRLLSLRIIRAAANAILEVEEEDDWREELLEVEREMFDQVGEAAR
jgi:hypothetical protein